MNKVVIPLQLMTLNQYTNANRTNRRTDPDNIAFQKKFILDGFVAAGLLSNDGWGEIAGWTEKFHIVKKEFQRVEIKERFA